MTNLLDEEGRKALRRINMRYWLNTSCHRVLHRFMKPLDVNLILYRSGKALGIINDR